jgi:hypothetical protein
MESQLGTKNFTVTFSVSEKDILSTSSKPTTIRVLNDVFYPYKSACVFCPHIIELLDETKCSIYILV